MLRSTLAKASLALIAALAALSGSTDAASLPKRALSTYEKAALRVVYSYPGPAPPQRLLDLISMGRVGGIIFFGENLSGVNIHNVIAQLDAANAKAPNPLPLLYMTDQEGGMVRRLPGAPVESAKTVGLSADVASAALKQGQEAGNNLKDAFTGGVPLNLAPILGVYRKDGDFLDQFQRSFSNNTNVVNVAASNFIKGQQGVGVLATAKHFPGLGAAPRGYNTDLEPVYLNQSLTTLNTVDIFPYKAAIANGVKLVMPSWAIYPAGDKLPSGLSPYWIKTRMRGELGFQGVTISDAIEAGALKPFGTNAQVSITAFGAGMDIVLASARDVSQGEAILNATVSALQSGAIAYADNEEAIARIKALRVLPA